MRESSTWYMGVLGFESLTRVWIGRSAIGCQKKWKLQNGFKFDLRGHHQQVWSSKILPDKDICSNIMIFKYYIISLLSYLTLISFPIFSQAWRDGCWHGWRGIITTYYQQVTDRYCLQVWFSPVFCPQHRQPLTITGPGQTQILRELNWTT